MEGIGHFGGEFGAGLGGDGGEGEGEAAEL